MVFRLLRHDWLRRASRGGDYTTGDVPGICFRLHASSSDEDGVVVLLGATMFSISLHAGGSDLIGMNNS